MSLIDDLNKMKKKGRQVVSIEYVLKHLGSIEREHCPNCTQIPVYDMATFGRGLQDVNKGGDLNRTLSKVD